MIIIVVLLVSLRSRLPVRLPGRPGGPFWAGPKTGLVGPTLAGARNGSEMITFNKEIIKDLELVRNREFRSLGPVGF